MTINVLYAKKKVRHGGCIQVNPNDPSELIPWALRSLVKYGNVYYKGTQKRNQPH